MLRRTRPARANWPLLTLIFGSAAVGVCYVAFMLTLQLGGPYQPGAIIAARCMDVFALAWFLWFGASVGSFLNVVAWRMPRGRPINGFSACPFCTTPIKAYDNVPLIGWLNLKGRCRSCRLPIPARYPIVELFVGVSIALVGYVGIYLAGANQPLRMLPQFEANPLLWASHIAGADIGINVYHIVGLAGVWTFALVRIDGFGLPAKLVACVLSAAIIPPLVWPILQLVPYQLQIPEAWTQPDRLSSVMFLIAGLVAAIGLARVLGRTACPSADPKMDPLGKDTRRLLDLIWVLSIPGVLLGWHALIAIVVIANVSALFLKTRFPQCSAYQWLLVAIPPTMALHLALWRALNSLSFWPAPNNAPVVFLVWMGALLVLSLGLRSSDEKEKRKREEEVELNDNASANEPAPSRAPL